MAEIRLPPPTQSYRLTVHAASRLVERTRLSPQALDRALACGVELPCHLDSPLGCKLFWSLPDDRAYLAVYNRRSLKILTLYEAYHWEGEQFVGATYVCPAVDSEDLPRVYRIRRRDIAYCLIRAGLAVRPEFAPHSDPPPTEELKAPQEDEYRARILDWEGRRHFCRVIRVEHGLEVNLAGLMFALRQALARRGLEISQVRDVVLERRPAGRRYRQLPPIEEIPISPYDLSDARGLDK